MKKILTILIAINCISMSVNAQNVTVTSEKEKAIERVEVSLDAEIQDLRKSLDKEIKSSIEREIMQTCKSDKKTSISEKNLLAIL
tara:strand:- start:1493 stop:1747 length:255 start_codon:yes stop_codon:yes gene_type:complete